ncbi:MAG: cysteine desulfurase family protein [Eubacteriales bacterium]|nr:cysteine desulfurase family protein [Eubacteriales bacterium]
MIYFDHAATSPLCASAREALIRWQELYFNSSSQYQAAMPVREAVESARADFARQLHSEAYEIYFTSGATESNNWAFFSALHQPRRPGKHILISSIEHPSVRECAFFYRRQGFELELIPVDTDGRIDLDFLRQHLRADTCLVSIMAVNNEVGTIQDLEAISEILRNSSALFHCDAVQAFPYIPLEMDRLAIDLLSLSAHKFNGPKGVGLLYMRESKRRELELPAMLYGGPQERERRAGTSPVPLVAAMAAALSEKLDKFSEDLAHLRVLSQALEAGLRDRFPDCRIHCRSEFRHPGHLNVSIPGLSGETALIALDMAGFCVSHGSACASGSLDPSPVLLAMGASRDEAQSSLRFSFGASNQLEEVDLLLTELENLRAWNL